MKKLLLAAGIVLLSAMPIFAEQVIRLNIGMTIEKYYKNGDTIIFWVKDINDPEIVKPINNQKVAYEVDKYGIRCQAREFNWFGTRTYGTNNQLLDKFDLPFAQWEKINNSETDAFPRMLHSKLCK